MDNFLKILRKFKDKKVSKLSKKDKFISKQLNLIDKILTEEELEKKAVNKILSKIKELELEKEFNITEQELQKIIKEKYVEQRFAQIFFNLIDQLKLKLIELKDILISQKDSGFNISEFVTKEEEKYKEIEDIFNKINYSEYKIKEYLEDMKELTYKKRWIKSGQIIAKTINKVLFGVKVEGIENIPKNGPCVLAPHHHHAMIDPLLLGAVVDRPIYFLTSVETYFPIYDKFLVNIGCIPFLRDDNRYNPRREESFIMKKEDVDTRAEKLGLSHTRSILKMLKHLKHHDALVICPSGDAKIIGTYKRPNDEEFLPPQEGFVYIPYLAKRKYGLDVPIIPIGIKYDNLYLNFFSRSITLKIGKPIYLESNLQKMNKKDLRHMIDKYTNHIHNIIKKLS